MLRLLQLNILLWLVAEVAGHITAGVVALEDIALLLDYL